MCEKLHEMNLIDENYGKEEFSFMRSYYQKALYQFLTTAKSTSVDAKTAIVSSVCVSIPHSEFDSLLLVDFLMVNLFLQAGQVKHSFKRCYRMVEVFD